MRQRSLNSSPIHLCVGDTFLVIIPFFPVHLAECLGPRFSHKPPSGILTVPHIQLHQDLLQPGWRISQLQGIGVYMKLQLLQGRCLTFHPCIFTVKSLGERNAQALCIRSPGRNINSTLSICMLSYLMFIVHLKMRDIKTLI